MEKMENVKMTILATPNRAKKTYTIRKVFKGVTLFKYRTEEMKTDEFARALNFNQGDWGNYLKTNEFYYRIH